MKKFTINELERFSGIKANTLRAWEKRYNLLTPARSPGNIRQYTIEELIKLLNISLLTKNGFAISRLAEAGPETWLKKVNALDGVDNDCRKGVNMLLLRLHDLDCKDFEDVLNQLIKVLPIEIVARKTLHPFLLATGLMWQGHRLMEEHLVVTAIRKKLIMAIELLPQPKPEARRVILFIPDNKLLDLGLLYSNYILKAAGFQIVYLGSDVTYKNLVKAVETWDPDFLFTYLASPQSFPLDNFLIHLAVENASCQFIHAQIPGHKSRPMSRANYASFGFDDCLAHIVS